MKSKERLSTALTDGEIQANVHLSGEYGVPLAAEIERLKHELVAKDEALENLVKDFAKANNTVVELKHDLAAKEEELSRMDQAWGRDATRKCQLARKVQGLKHDLAAKEAAIKVLTQENGELRQQIAVLDEHKRMAEAGK